MGTWRTYIAPIREDGSFDDYREVTNKTIGDSVGKIKRKTESSEYDIGIAANDSLSLKLSNQDGLFSHPDLLGSMFPYRREGSKVKVTYLFGLYEPICGVAICGFDVLGPEIDAFEGYLTEKNIKQDIAGDTISFTVLGKEAILSRYEANIAGLTTSSTVEVALLQLLSLPEFAAFFTVDSSNINPAINPTLGTINPDSSIDYLSEKTTFEAVSSLLESTASVLYIEDSILYITDRQPRGGDSSFKFYGQASADGLENIQNITNYTTGMNRVFNFWKWKDTQLVAKDVSSIDNYGTIKHSELDFEATTNPTARQTLLDTYRDEFAEPKVELELSTPANIETIGIRLFNKVVIDYPNVPIQAGKGLIPVWNTGTMIWQDQDSFDPSKPFFVWPDGLFDVVIEANQQWKVIGITTDTKSDLITFKLREV